MLQGRKNQWRLEIQSRCFLQGGSWGVGGLRFLGPSPWAWACLGESEGMAQLWVTARDVGWEAAGPARSLLALTPQAVGDSDTACVAG